MSYHRRKHPDVVYFDENTTSGKKPFGGRLAHGKILESEAISFLEKYFRKNKISLKIWPSEVYQREIMGLEPCNKLDAALGDIIITQELHRGTKRQVKCRLDCKFSYSNEASSIGYHGDPTKYFNSEELTFYLTKVNNDIYCVWAQDLAMLPCDGIDLKSGNKWWSSGLISNYLIPIEDILSIVTSTYNDDFEKDKNIKCDLIEALRKKYNPIAPQSVSMIASKQQSTQVPFTQSTIPVKLAAASIFNSAIKTYKLQSATPGYYATVPNKILVDAENRNENTILILSYCTKPGESPKADVKVEFNDIRNIWKTLVKGNNKFIRSKDLESYMKPV